MAVIPEYRLSDDHSIGSGHNQITLPAGSCVKPIDKYYVPKHCFQMTYNLYFDEKTEVFCYCRYGIVKIPRKIIYRVN